MSVVKLSSLPIVILVPMAITVILAVVSVNVILMVPMVIIVRLSMVNAPVRSILPVTIANNVLKVFMLSPSVKVCNDC